MSNQPAETYSEISHDHSIYAENIFTIGNFPVTNALLNSWLAVFIIVIIGLFLRSRIRMIPRGLQNFMEFIVESLVDLFDSVTGSREKTYKFFPFVFSFFIFILINNWLGLLPGIGSIGQIVSEHGYQAFIPFFRSGTADLNTTLSLAIIGVVASHIIGVLSIGIWKHLNKFINIKALLEIPKKVKEDPMILMINPIKFLVGFMEIISELAKVVSLSFRLFGNVFAGEVLIASMSAILAFGLPLPFMFLEVMIGLIQALVFSMLILSYLSMATIAEEH